MTDVSVDRLSDLDVVERAIDEALSGDRELFNRVSQHDVMLVLFRRLTGPRTPKPHEHASRFDMCMRLCDESWYRIDKCECGMIRVNYGEWTKVGDVT